MTKQNQENSVSVATVTMDTRKFLSAINSSAQTQIAFFENAVQKLGEQSGKLWKLTALQNSKIIFEDTKTKEYFIAEHVREKGGRVKISNISRISLYEDKKAELFGQSCQTLVEALDKNDAKSIDAAYDRIVAGRFRSVAVPSNGIVKAKDGVIRQLVVQEDRTPGKILAEKIIAKLSDQVTINESGELEGSFIKGERINTNDLGVSELTTRRLVAKYMSETAENAFRSPSFQTLVEAVAAYVSKDKLNDAIVVASKFLREHQEFCLLNTKQWNKLVGDALAVKAVFNEDLATDAATILRKTNLKVNRDELVSAWRQTAEKAQHPVMLENVDRLDAADNFEEAYEEFLPVIFEATGETTKGALLAGLQLLKKQVTSGDINEPTAQDIDQLITSLETKGDSDSVWKAMEALDGVRRHLKGLEGLEDFDKMPGPMEAGDKGADDKGADAGLGDAGAIGAAGDAGAGVSVGAEGSSKPIEITVKIDPIAMAKQQEPAAAAAAPASGGGDEFDLAALDDIEVEGGENKGGENNGGGDQNKGGENNGGDQNKGGNSNDLNGIDDLLDSVQRTAKPINESVAEEILAEFASELGPNATVEMINAPVPPVVAESQSSKPTMVASDDPNDPYTLPADLTVEGIDKDYATITEDDISLADSTDFDREVTTRTAGRGETPEDLKAQAEAFVRTHPRWANQVRGITDLKKQQEYVQEKAAQLVANRITKQTQTESVGKFKPVLSEDQSKSPLRVLARRGLKRAAINKLVKEGNLQWVDRAKDSVLGEFRGVKFVLDNSENPLALLSEDGSIQVPVPNELVKGALYIAETTDEAADADAFVEWLNENIEALRIVEDKSIEEMAKAEGHMVTSEDWDKFQKYLETKKAGKEESAEKTGKEEPATEKPAAEKDEPAAEKPAAEKDEPAEQTK